MLSHLEPPEALTSMEPCVGFAVGDFDLELIATSVQSGFDIRILLVGRRKTLSRSSHRLGLQGHVCTPGRTGEA